MEDIKEFLRSIGLGKNEVEIYLMLVRKGISSVLEISKETKIHRSNVYEAITYLMDKSLIYEVLKDNKKVFYARQPASLLGYLKSKEVELKQVVEMLESTNAKPNESSNVRISRGRFALRESLMSLLECGNPISVYGIPLKAPEIIGPVLENFHARRTEKKILMRHIYNKGEINSDGNGKDRVKILNQMDYTEAKHLPMKYNSPVSTNICGSKVILFIWHENDDVTVIEIDNAEVAKAYQNYFELLWKSAKSL